MVPWFLISTATVLSVVLIAYPTVFALSLKMPHQHMTGSRLFLGDPALRRVLYLDSNMQVSPHQYGLWACIRLESKHCSRLSALLLKSIRPTCQADQIAKEMRNIAKKITISNNIQVQGSGGPMALLHTYGTSSISRLTSTPWTAAIIVFFFVYHPDTQWHGAFRRLLDSNPLDETFCGMTNDLFALCRWMLCMRAELQEQRKDREDEVHFHVLIPAYQSLVIPHAFMLLQALFPLTFEGEIANGEKLMWLNLPLEEGTDTPRDVGNLHELNENTWKREASVVSTFFGTWVSLGSASMVTTAAIAAVCPP